MKKNWDFSDYEVVKEIKVKGKWSYIVLSLLLVGVVIILMELKISIYQKQSLIKEDDYYSLIVNSNLVSYFEGNNELYLKGKKYNYKTLEVSKDYTNLNNEIYQTIKLEVLNLNTKAIVNEVYFLKGKGSILDRVIWFLKGGSS